MNQQPQPMELLSKFARRRFVKGSAPPRDDLRALIDTGALLIDGKRGKCVKLGERWYIEPMDAKDFDAQINEYAEEALRQ